MKLIAWWLAPLFKWQSGGALDCELFLALYTHTLSVSDGHLKIVEKRVDLIDSGEAFEPIEVFI
jgi:hypothetical protein